MKNEEKIDLVNEKDEIIGTIPRSLTEGDVTKIHREVAVLLINNKKEILLQQRSSSKIQDPGGWTISVGGHVKAGEYPYKAAQREIKEELGLDLNVDFIAKKFDLENDYVNESRIFWLYCAKTNLESFDINKEEIQQVKWVKPSELNKYNLPIHSKQNIEKILTFINIL